jgi:hypothetical protein
MGNVGKVTVTLNQFQHIFPDDVDLLLVGPGGQKAIIMSDVGGNFPVSGIDITLDGDAITLHLNQQVVDIVPMDRAALTGRELQHPDPHPVVLVDDLRPDTAQHPVLGHVLTLPVAGYS